MAIWPFGRRRNADEPAPEPAAAGSASPSPGEADVARPERTPTGDWMTLPPVATTMATPMPTTFRVQRLPEILTSHQDSRLSGALGHAVSAEAPSGTIGGLAAAAGSVHHEGTASTAELREPHRPPAPEAPVAPLVQRRLETTVDPTPLGAAGAATANLPEPAVSRVLANPAPLAASAPDAAPLPVARVVDAPVAPSPASTAALASSATSSAPSADGAPLTGDTRVGGFEVPLEDLLAEQAPTSDLLGAPTGELAPPIQPRRVQRQAAPGASTPSLSSPHGPSVQTERDGTTSPEPTVSLLGDAAPTTTSPLSSTGAGAATPERAASGEDLPLVGPGAATPAGPDGDLPISRLTDPGASAPASTSTPSTASDTAASSHKAPSSTTAGSDSAGASAPTAPLVGATDLLAGGAPRSPETAADPPTSPADLSMPLQRKAIVDSASPTSAARPVGPDTTGAGTAPLLGGGTDLTASEPGGVPAAGASADLPLVEPLSSPSPSVVDAAAGVPTGFVEEPSVGADAEDAADGTAPMAPTLGQGDGLGVQRLADTGLAHQHADSTAGGTSSLLLAPVVDAGGALQPPAPAPGAPSASASAAPLASSAPLPFVRPLAGASSVPAASVAGGISTLGVQRSAASGATGESPGSASPAAVEPVLVRRLAGSDGLPSGVVTPEHLAPLQRSVDAAPSVATPSTGTGALPLAGASAPASGDLPLHTPAAAIPSAADVAVKAGFAERGPSGNLFYTSPPGGEPVVQRAVASALESTPASAAAAADQLMIRPTASEAGPAAPGGAPAPEPSRADLAKQARSLYPFIRNALESDLRRELEGKHRPNRFRP